jgi:hypothetical protein
MMQMSKKKELEEVKHKINIANVEFSKELNIVLDYNANLHPNAKEEINRVKEFYDNTL